MQPHIWEIGAAGLERCWGEIKRNMWDTARLEGAESRTF